MKLICERDALHRAISAVISRARGKTKIPILQHLKLETAGARLLIAATDMDTRSDASCPAEVSVPGARCVPADRLAQVVSGMPAGAQVELQMKNGELHVRCGQSRYRLPTLEAEDFPAPWEPRNPVSFALPCRDARALFGETLAAITIDGSRRMLEGGCLYQPASGELAVAATDGTKIIRRTVSFGAFAGRHIVPKSAMVEIVKLAHEGEIAFVCADNMISASSGATTFASKLIEATYPDVERIIQAPAAQFMLVDRKDLVNALKRLSALQEEGSKIRLNWAASAPLELTIDGAGHGFEAVACECDLDAGTMLFAPAVLDQMLIPLTGDVLQLHVFGDNKPLRIIDPSDENLLVMGMGCRDTAPIAPPEN